jgi:nitroreductase
VELDEAIVRRRMCRRFLEHPVPPDVLGGVLAAAVSAPSAGFSQGVELVVLEGEAERARFWELTSQASWRDDPGPLGSLLRVPVIVLPVLDPSAYESRYARPDKAGSGLAGVAAQDWPVPYWIVDGAFAVMLMLLAATEARLGSLFFRLHRGERRLLDDLGAPRQTTTIGAVALGWPDAGGEVVGAPRRSAGERARPRRRRPLEELVHRGHW